MSDVPPTPQPSPSSSAAPPPASTNPLRLMRLRGREYAVVVALGVGQAASIGAFIVFVQQAIDRLAIFPVLASDMWPILGRLALASVAIAVFRGAEFTVSESLGFRYVARLRLAMHGYLLGLPARRVQAISRGGLLLRFTGDLTTLRTWISRGLARGIVSLMTVLGASIVLATISVTMAAVMLGCLLLGAAVSMWVGIALRAQSRRVRRRRSLLTSNIAEQISSLAVVQVFGRAGGERSRFARQNVDLVAAQDHMARTRGVLRGVASLAGSVAVVGVLVVGTVEIAAGTQSVGAVVAGMIAVRLLTGPVRTLGLSNDYFHSAQVSRRKVLQYLADESPADEDTRPPLRVQRGAISVRGVTVDGALDGVDLDVPGGRLVAVTGANGAGKSSLLAVISGFLEPRAGTVHIDGQDLAEVRAGSLHRRIGMVSPELPLMRGSLRRNVGYRLRSATDAEIEHVVLACRIDEVVAGRPEGLDTWLLEGGTNLSLGERQRVALARAILGSPRILLLDEPTTNLDPPTKEVFRRVIARYDGTVVLVTHDPDEIELADVVCTMADGRIESVLDAAAYRRERDEARRRRSARAAWVRS